MKAQRTLIEKHYWNEEGAYSEEISQMTAEQVPAIGRAKNLMGEILRASNRLYYEYCNNGNGNAIVVIDADPEEIACPCCNGTGCCLVLNEDGEEEEIDCECCGGCGYVYEDNGGVEYRVNEYWLGFVNLIKEAFTDTDDDKNTPEFIKEAGFAMDSLKAFLEECAPSGDKWYFNDDNMHRYDLMMDLVYEYAMNHQNDSREIPAWYENE